MQAGANILHALRLCAEWCCIPQVLKVLDCLFLQFAFPSSRDGERILNYFFLISFFITQAPYIPAFEVKQACAGQQQSNPWKISESQKITKFAMSLPAMLFCTNMITSCIFLNGKKISQMPTIKPIFFFLKYCSPLSQPFRLWMTCKVHLPRRTEQKEQSFTVEHTCSVSATLLFSRPCSNSSLLCSWAHHSDA